jgi:RNA polymerase sigma-70 factor (ECF subfamily)
VYFADVAGFSYKEIAAIMETGQGTVSSRINRGREQLRNLLTDSPSQWRAQEGSRHRTVRPNDVQLSPAPAWVMPPAADCD